MNSAGQALAMTTPAASWYSTAVPMTQMQPAPMPLHPAPVSTAPMAPLQPRPMATVAVPMTPLQPAPMPTAPMFPLQPAPMPTAPMPTTPLMPLQRTPIFTVPTVPVHEVWDHNFYEVQREIGRSAAHARCVAVDVHYPGVVHGAGRQDLNALTAEDRYATVKRNVDALKPLQLGLAVFTDDGCVAAWEFNISGFDPAVDPHARQSLLYLAGLGLDCGELRQCGIPVAKLARVLRLMTNRKEVSWITHTGAYHVAYLMKILSDGNQLPRDMAGFMAAVRRSLGDDVYDVATMASDCRGLPPGLVGVARTLGLPPPLARHALAGSGSVLALEAFLKLRFDAFRGYITRYRGVLQGLQTA